jgi:hypothetical protein
MNIDQFKQKIKLAVQVGTIFDNPGKGTSAVTALSDRGISYVRGRSVIHFSYQDIFDAFEYFNGAAVTSNDLKSCRPTVFGSKANGHSCNCTFLFMLLRKIGISSEIGGRGVKGRPYFVDIFPMYNE